MRHLGRNRLSDIRLDVALFSGFGVGSTLLRSLDELRE